MKVTRKQAAANRERVLEAAGRQLRERGLDGVGVAELMQSAGLTHGAFYGQFDSKDELVEEALAGAFARSLDEFRERADLAGAGHEFAALLRSYLSRSHRDQPGLGCAVAALGAEAARRGPGLRHSFGEGIRAQIELLTQWVRGRTQVARRERAIAAYAGMVGALVLARSVDDPTLSAEILRSTRASLEAAYAPT